MAKMKGKFTKVMTDQMKGLVMLGTSNKKIAEIIGITEVTLYDWIKKYPEIDYIINYYAVKTDGQVMKVLHKLYDRGEYEYEYNN